jgi:membrane-bound serine protease (ClpP class)
MKRLRWVLSLLVLALSFVQPILAASEGQVLVLTLDATIAPAAREYLRRGLATADQAGAEAVILQLDTPGGDLGSLQEMVKAIRASRVPVVVYVAPRGAWAASAGAVLTMAGHASAMAPETAIGAASPVGGEGEDLGETMEAKVKNQLKATVAELVAHRSPEAQQLAAEMIDEARAVSSDEALRIGLIDFVAADLDDLLRQLDGFTVETIAGTHTLQLAGAETRTLGMTLIEQLLDILTNPNIVFLLLSIGVQAILIEISSPGGWVAGFIGAVCLALAAYGLGILTVNWFGLVFFLIAFVLFIVDIKAATHGGLTAAGIGSFIVGALVLFNSPGTPVFERVSIPLVILVGVLIGATFAIIVGFALRAQKTRIRTGSESLAGASGVAVSDFAPGGQVQAAGELWSADPVQGTKKIHKGDRVEVVKVEGLRLKVRKKG